MADHEPELARGMNGQHAEPDLTYVTRPLVYLAGPYTQPDPIENTRKTIDTAEALIASGLVTPFVPHLTMLWHLMSPQDLKFWYAYDLAVLSRCDALYRLPGESTGADAEVAFAHGIPLPVFTDQGDLENWAEGR